MPSPREASGRPIAAPRLAALLLAALLGGVGPGLARAQLPGGEAPIPGGAPPAASAPGGAPAIPPGYESSPGAGAAWSEAPGPGTPPPTVWLPPGAPAEAPREDLTHRHRGFFMRGALGVAYAQIQQTEPAGESRFEGFGLNFHVEIGGAIIENVALYGTLSSASFPSLDASAPAGSFDAVSGTLGGIGVGIGYYWMPANIHIDFTAEIIGLTLHDESGFATWSSETGFQLQLLAGKEWWVHRHLGLGPLLGLSFGKYAGLGEEMRSLGLHLSLSLTYN
ncbi:MAG: hypothetical protein OEY14_00075 [Myxococcales bacterium]|nr:hypothetical protein [Myxococcales bacterium]